MDKLSGGAFDVSVSQNLSSGITSVTVCGYKSIARANSIDVRPLTVLAGANSSGKSSFFQPLLLMKQTIEESYDPGSLLLNGPNVHMTSSSQLLSKCGGKDPRDAFEVGVEIGRRNRLSTEFRMRPNNKGFSIAQQVYRMGDRDLILRPNQSSDETMESMLTFSSEIMSMFRFLIENPLGKSYTNGTVEFSVIRERCFLKAGLDMGNGKFFAAPLSEGFEHDLRNILHLPGLRGNPERNYPATVINEESSYPGTFEKYVASIIMQWQESKDFDKLKKLAQYLRELGLTGRVMAQMRSDTEVELLVSRLIYDENSDFVSIADVGFGVSQTLPVIVALLFARRGQLVYIEQPELHLHPRAQYTLARILSDAAKRGVRVVVETHSSLLLRAIQTLVATGHIGNELVKLHWFIREVDSGITKVESTDVDSAGAFGDWPVDFDDVEMMAESAYLDAAELMGGADDEGYHANGD